MKKYKNKRTFERDCCLVEFLKNHRGRENIVSTDEVLKHLNDHGFQLSRTSLTPTIRKLMYEQYLPICFVGMLGYYWASTREDIMLTIDDCQRRIDGLQKHIDHLKCFIVN